MKQFSLQSAPVTPIQAPVTDLDIREIIKVQASSSGTSDILQRDDHYLIIWIDKGQGSYFIDQQKGVIAPHHLLFVKPGMLHRLDLTGEVRAYAISFKQSFLSLPDGGQGMFHQIFSRTQAIAVAQEQQEDMQCVLGLMLKEFGRNGPFRDELLQRYFRILLIHICGQFGHPGQTPRQNRNEEILQLFINKLEDHYRNEKMVAFYADRLSVTANYLNEVVKRTTGFSAGHHIRQRVVLEAKRRVLATNACMKNIAYELGFLDMAHFSKFFKNATGTSFTDFKNRESHLHPLL